MQPLIFFFFFKVRPPTPSRLLPLGGSSNFGFVNVQHGPRQRPRFERRASDWADWYHSFFKVSLKKTSLGEVKLPDANNNRLN